MPVFKRASLRIMIIIVLVFYFGPVGARQKYTNAITK